LHYTYRKLQIMKNKTILLITPIIFHYHVELINALKETGANVLFYPDQPQGALVALKRKLSTKYSKEYYDKIYDKIKEVRIDYFFLINGKGITRKFIQKIKQDNKGIKLITYQWDSIARNNLERKTNYLYILDLFDKCFSFDHKDANENKELEYLSNFHTIKNKSNTNMLREIDFLMVGSYTDERYFFVKKMSKEFRQKKIVFYNHLYIPWHHYARNVLLKGKFLNPMYLKYYPISKKVLKKLYLNSKATIDIQHPNQTGFTMRVLEGLAYGCKIITTNKNIVKENFYSADNISIFELNSFWKNLKISFIEKKTDSNKSIDELYIKQWIKKIFDK